MTYDFTPAARRVLQFTNHFAVEGAFRPFLLLGLLSESESRAASLLDLHGVNSDVVQANWPCCADFDGNLQLSENWGEMPIRLQPQLAEDLNRIEPVLAEMPRPLAISTEHLLLAILDSSSDVRVWLNQQGMLKEDLAAEIFRLHGVTPGPAELNETTAEAPNRVDLSSNARIRILDASGNRASEALRVIEDFLRFGLDDAHLSTLSKQLRHDLTQALNALPMSQRLAVRDTANDVGTSIATGSEYQRDSDESILEANFARLQQSLRSLEEFSKAEHPDIAQAIEQLRYRAYTLHRAVGITRECCQRLADAQLYVLLDGGEDIASFRQLAAKIANSGIDVVQLRDKALNDRELLQRAQILREVTEGSRVLFIMNDRPDLAVLADADGVHVGQEELSVRDVRKIIGPDKLIGVSTHRIEQARSAVIEGANYIGVGPIFPSRTKQFDDLAGLDFAREVAREISLPAYAIGGIHTGNAQQVIDAGLHRFAVGAAISQAPDPVGAVRELLKKLCVS